MAQNIFEKLSEKNINYHVGIAQIDFKFKLDGHCDKAVAATDRAGFNLLI